MTRDTSHFLVATAITLLMVAIAAIMPAPAPVRSIWVEVPIPPAQYRGPTKPVLVETMSPADVNIRCGGNAPGEGYHVFGCVQKKRGRLVVVMPNPDGYDSPYANLFNHELGHVQMARDVGYAKTNHDGYAVRGAE